MKLKVTYTGTVFSAVKRAKLKKEIMQAAQSNPTMRADIRRVFHMANERIKRIQAAGVISPALQGLNADRNYHFSMSNDWTALKMEYGKAVAFLKQPTSTTAGARQYGKHIQARYDLTDTEFAAMQNKILDITTSTANTDWVERYLMRYKDFTGELEAAAADVSSQVEREGVQMSEAIEREIERQAEAALDQIDEETERLKREIISAFNKFEL